jgi:hypothetical protein
MKALVRSEAAPSHGSKRPSDFNPPRMKVDYQSGKKTGSQDPTPPRPAICKNGVLNAPKKIY